ncbi:thiamine diphosphokinase [Chryseomicrobium sp. FSL W7-1435]|uniref:thiamine diphosphokinase n=1 Tax=Chryseomicrobium sp. FSL W7-1435 TaxID=2921704 RepID=UPI003159A887
MHIGICGGGPKQEIPSNLRADYWIGADSGAIRLLEIGITPDLVIGDLDSIREAEKQQWAHALQQAVQLPVDKDETDTFLALEKATKLQPRRITLVGVTGGRLDHYQAVLHDVAAFQERFPEIHFELVDKQNKIYFLVPGETTIEADGYRYCSFFAWKGSVTAITLQGFKFPVTNDTITSTSSRFTSNEILKDSGSISFSSGICLCIQSSEESGD